MRVYRGSSIMTEKEETLQKQVLRQSDEIMLLKQMISIENKEKYDAYIRIKELTAELNKLKNKD